MTSEIRPLRVELDTWLADVGLYRVSERTLVLSDPHLGYEETLVQEGVLVPRAHLEELKARVERILAGLGVSRRRRLERLILNGDLRQSFGPFSRREWVELTDFLGFLSPFCEEIVLVEGNHDPALHSLARHFEKPRLRIHLSFEAGGWLFLHGDACLETLPGSVRTVVIGHEHPAVGLKDPVTGRRELYKCFLRGRFRDRVLWALPSANRLVKGNDLTQEGPHSPLLREGDWEASEAFLISDGGEVYAFGPVACWRKTTWL